MSALLTFAGYPFCCIYEFACDFNIGIDLRYSVDQFRSWHNPVVMKLCVITLFAAGSVQQRPCIQYIGCAAFFAANGDFGFRYRFIGTADSICPAENCQTGHCQVFADGQRHTVGEQACSGAYDGMFIG